MHLTKDFSTVKQSELILFGNLSIFSLKVLLLKSYYHC